MVLVIRSDDFVYAPVTETNTTSVIAESHIQRSRQSRRQWLREILQRQLSTANRTPSGEVRWEDGRTLESSVLDEFGVDATVSRVVDVLEHDTIGERRCGIAAARGHAQVQSLSGSGERKDEGDDGSQHCKDCH